MGTTFINKLLSSPKKKIDKDCSIAASSTAAYEHFRFQSGWGRLDRPDFHLRPPPKFISNNLAARAPDSCSGPVRVRMRGGMRFRVGEGQEMETMRTSSLHMMSKGFLQAYFWREDSRHNNNAVGKKKELFIFSGVKHVSSYVQWYGC